MVTSLYSRDINIEFAVRASDDQADSLRADPGPLTRGRVANSANTQTALDGMLSSRLFGSAARRCSDLRRNTQTHTGLLSIRPQGGTHLATLVTQRALGLVPGNSASDLIREHSEQS